MKNQRFWPPPSKLCVLLLACLLIVEGRRAGAETRDPWLWPFASDSIWNTPIGSEVVFVPAGIGAAPRVGVDEELLFRVSKSAPHRKLFAPKSWQQRAGGTTEVGGLRIDDGLIVPDARKWQTPNNCAALLMPDGRTVKHIGVLCRPEPGGPVFGYPFNPDSDLFGDGIRGSHGGSAMSALGGSIRKGELTGDAPIRHALKVDLFSAKYAYYGEDRKGFRWPATKADGYAQERYKGTNRALVMGSLLALPPLVTEESVALKTPIGKKIFRALQDYGAYLVDDAAWECHYICAEQGVAEEVEKKYGYKLDASKEVLADLNALFTRLAVVDNNAPDRIGGGIPRAPLAPPLGPVPAVPEQGPPAPPKKPAAAAAPPKAANAWSPAEGFYPEYPEAWRTLHRNNLERAKKGGINVLFLGDSLTQGWDKALWKEHYAPLGAANFGVGGDGTPQILWRIERGELDGLAPKVVVLMVGINNVWPGWSAADTIKGVETVVGAIRAKLPETKILLLGVLPIWDKANGVRAKIKAINAGLAPLDDGRTLRFLDFGEKLLAADGSLGEGLFQKDNLHLTPQAYRLTADAIDPLLHQLLQ